MERLTENDIITFGKYKGRKVSDIINEDPSYVMWLYKSTNTVNLSDETIIYLHDWDKLDINWGDLEF